MPTYRAQPDAPNSPPPPEVRVVHSKRIACDGVGGALGHPRVFLEMGEADYVECGYCDRRFELAPGAHGHGHETEFADPAANDPDGIDPGVLD